MKVQSENGATSGTEPAHPLGAYLACPECARGRPERTPQAGGHGGLCCSGCRIEYAVRDRIPDLSPKRPSASFQVEADQWDAQAERYEEQRAADRAYMAGVTAGVDALGPVRGMKVLDAGCGTGLTTQMLVRREAVVAALDASQASLAVCQRKPGGNAVMAVRGDVKRLPFADDSFDCVLCANLLQQLPDVADRVRVIAELARVTRPSGRVVVTAHAYSVRKRWAGWSRKGPAGGHSGPVKFVHRFELTEFRRLLLSSLLVERVTGAAFPLPYRYKLTPVSVLTEFLLSRITFVARFGEMFVGQCKRSESSFEGRTRPMTDVDAAQVRK